MNDAPTPAGEAGTNRDQRLVALLRGVNVGGHGKLAMSDLRTLVAGLGFAEPKTLLQSGNLVFTGDGRSSDELERLLEEETAARLGLRPDYLIRTPAEWRVVIDDNPFPDEAERNPRHFVAFFLKEPPRAEAVAALQAAISGPEIVRAGSRHLYVVYPEGQGRSKLAGAVIEKALATRGTARNWNTVLKLADLVLT